MKRFFLFSIMALFTICDYGQCYPTYFMSDKAANTAAVIKQNHIKTESVYGYHFVNNIFKHPVIQDSVLRYSCNYNTDGNPVMRKMYYAGRINMKDSIIYDVSGQPVKLYRYSVLKNGENRLDFIQEFFYDKSGNKIREQGTYSLKDSVHNYVTRFIYNIHRQPASEICTERDTLFCTTTYTYNQEGDIIRSVNTNPNGVIQYGTLYEYNRRKNKVTVYSLDKKHVSRELEYNKYGQCTLLLSTFLRPNTIDLFNYREDRLFFEMKKVESTLIKQLNRHYYTQY